MAKETDAVVRLVSNKKMDTAKKVMISTLFKMMISLLVALTNHNLHNPFLHNLLNLLKHSPLLLSQLKHSPLLLSQLKRSLLLPYPPKNSPLHQNPLKLLPLYLSQLKVSLHKFLKHQKLPKSHSLQNLRFQNQLQSTYQRTVQQ